MRNEIKQSKQTTKKLRKTYQALKKEKEELDRRKWIEERGAS